MISDVFQFDRGANLTGSPRMLRPWRGGSIAHQVHPGITIIEMIVASTMLAVLLGSAVPMMRALTLQQRALERRAVALEALAAVSEQLGNQRWDDLTQQAADQAELPDLVRPSLPGAKLTATVTDESSPVAAKRLLVELTWNAPNGQPTGPARLTTWVFRDVVPAKSNE